MRIAVCFFGLIRNITYTLPSIDENLLSPLRAQNYVDVFVHTFTHEVYNNPRANELNVSLNREDFLRLKPRLFEVEVQGVADKEMQRLFAGSSLIYQCSTLKNFVRQKYSMHKVFQLVTYAEQVDKLQYDVIVAARPDTMIASKVFVPSSISMNMSRKMIAIPNTHQNEGINDRFAIGTRTGMIDYLQQYTSLFKKGGFHQSTTEEFVCNHIASRRVRVMVIGMCIIRVRANGKVPLYDNISHPFAQVEYPTCIRHEVHSSAKPHPCLAYWHVTQASLRSLASKKKYSRSVVHSDTPTSTSPTHTSTLINVFRWLSGRTPTIDHEAMQKASAVCEGFSTVVFTSFTAQYMPDLTKTVEHPHADVCHVAFIHNCDKGMLRATVLQWHIVCFSVGAISARKATKIPKLIPHILFPKKTTMFIDSKLRLHADIHLLLQYALPSPSITFAAFGHPVPCQKRCKSVFAWVRREALLVAQAGRTSSIDTLVEQVHRYAHDMHVPEKAYSTYIDTGILIQRDSGPLFDAWKEEFSSVKNSGRDQISFARVVASNHFNGMNILPSTPPHCSRFCHWWVSPDMATLHRLNKRPTKTHGIRLADIECGFH